jgi:hypothetical protein
MRLQVVTAGAVLCATQLACGSGGDTTAGTFAVDFPTTDDAIATSGVQVFAYQTTQFEGGASDACQTLVEERRLGNLNTTPIASSAVVTPCQLMNGAGKVAISFGNYAFLAVGQQMNNGTATDLLLGCAEQTISSSNTVVIIPLSLASTAMVPTTQCSSLMQSCSGGC